MKISAPVKTMILSVLAALLCLALGGAGAEEAADIVFAPQGDYRVFCENGLYGVRDLDGNTVVPAKYNGIQTIRNDLCVVETGDPEDVVCGLWRLSTAEELLPCEYYDIGITGTMVLTSSVADPELSSYSYIHIVDPETGSVILEAEKPWEHFLPLADGRFFTPFCDYWEDEEEIERAGLVAPDGTVLIEGDFTEVSTLPGSRGLVKAINQPEGICRYYNANTGAWLEGTWRWGIDFVDGYAAVWGVDRGWYVIDETGRAVSPDYERIAEIYGDPQYGQGFFAVQQADGWYVIRVSPDAEPEVLLGPVDCGVTPQYMGNGIFALPVTEGTLVFSAADGRSLMLDHGMVVACHADCMEIKIDGEYGYLFADFSSIEPAYDDAVPFLGDYGFVKTGGAWHPIDRAGHVDLSVSYPWISIFSDIEDPCNTEPFYLVENNDDGYLCLNPALEPFTFRCFVPNG